MNFLYLYYPYLMTFPVMSCYTTINTFYVLYLLSTFVSLFMEHHVRLIYWLKLSTFYYDELFLFIKNNEIRIEIDFKQINN